jgi:hypothetical protein
MHKISRSILSFGASLALIGCSQGDAQKSPVISNSPAPVADADISHAEIPEPRPSVTRSAESHSHGGAALSIAAENTVVVMELDTPLYNLLGFEHAPNTTEEKIRAEAVEARLSSPETLFRLNPEAGCSYVKPAQNITLFEQAHDGHEHDAQHQDVILNYELRCEDIQKLETLKILFFNDFPYFKALELVYLGPSQPISAELSPSRPIADLTR